MPPFVITGRIIATTRSKPIHSNEMDPAMCRVFFARAGA
jgi:hypothetical protein